MYQHVDDIDLFAGMMMEVPCANGGLVGCTFQCLIADVFARAKFGDRFYYEFGGQPGSFTEREANYFSLNISSSFLI